MNRGGYNRRRTITGKIKTSKSGYDWKRRSEIKIGIDKRLLSLRKGLRMPILMRVKDRILVILVVRIRDRSNLLLNSIVSHHKNNLIINRILLILEMRTGSLRNQNIAASIRKNPFKQVITLRAK
jgi:hypothetical protein